MKDPLTQASEGFIKALEKSRGGVCSFPKEAISGVYIRAGLFKTMLALKVALSSNATFSNGFTEGDNLTCNLT